MGSRDTLNRLYLHFQLTYDHQARQRDDVEVMNVPHDLTLVLLQTDKIISPLSQDLRPLNLEGS